VRDKDLDVVLFRRYRWTDGDSGSYFCGGRNWKMGFMRGTDIIHEGLAEETIYSGHFPRALDGCVAQW
jgi:hypothetical protein